ncbi:transposase, putative [Stappia aggregata IAM 12614]|uniref:Transposase, putative n=1 Tax=Roseibium aggregatum (strain ATCC 25650 / DSM 13394 / JCM 20685 / NBRC 16684 / NCIMB 2208 / IAM 12614 / B1) TaxID=384765 RepID=A0P401_ROSAI|nr:transposase, putative [Stappia aggregata IAM 12614] [Roseibium aggregatum IAM 12614]
MNNIIEQDHRFIKKLTRPMMGFKAFHSASATLDDGIETAHMIRKGQLQAGCACLPPVQATRRITVSRQSQSSDYDKSLRHYLLMICSSVNLVRFIVRPQVGRTLIDDGGIIPWQVK